MAIYKSLLKFFKNHYWLFLIIIVTISYGQMMQMYIWKDDNALFFKLFHIEDRAGYFGYGLIGSGLYRFLVLPHWLVFRLFGADQTWPFYFQAFIYYVIASISIYQLFRRIFTEGVGKMASFLFGCGYIASEGFLWLNESIVHSLSIILVCTTLISYYYFSKKRTIFFYVLTLTLYVITGFVTPVRTQYFIALLILFDLFWVVKKKTFKDLCFWILRSIPFLITFYWLYVRLADDRTQALPDYIRSILSGRIYNLYSLFGTVGNIFFPETLQNLFLKYFTGLLIKPHMLIEFKVFLIFIVSGSFIWFSLKVNKNKSLSLIFVGVALIWLILSKSILSSPQITPSLQGDLAVFTGGLVLCVILFSWLVVNKRLKTGIFFLSAWLLGNLFGYVSYVPLHIYSTTDRYLAHSFVPLVGLLALLVYSQKKKLAFIAVIAWGVFNIYSSVIYQYDIVQNRSNVARDFYTQLKNELPVIHKGDVIYFDIANNSISGFQSAFSVGSMPETTALAWRYGLDRYDFQLFSDYADFKKVLNATPLDKIYTFWYSDKSLINTTSITRQILNEKDPTQVEAAFPVETKGLLLQQASGSKLEQPDLVINMYKPITSILPIELSLNINAIPLNIENQNFPIVSGIENGVPVITKNPELTHLAFDYAKFKQDILETAKYSSSSDWQDRVISNSHDKDTSTVWEADRILWQKGNEYLTIDLNSVQNIDKYVWINGFANNTPSKYLIETSIDGLNFQPVKEVANSIRLDTTTPNVVDFNPIEARFVRMRIQSTLNEDSPAIAEAWVVSSSFDGLDILKTEEYLKHPFQYLPNLNTFNNLLELSNYQQPIKIYWISDKSTLWETSDLSFIDLKYDGLDHMYNVIIYSGGSKISALKLGNLEIPSIIQVKELQYKHVH